MLQEWVEDLYSRIASVNVMVMLDQALTTLKGYVHQALDLYKGNASVIGAVAVCLLIGLGMCIRWVLYRRAHRYDKWRGHMATGRQREIEVQHIVADAITDTLEDLRYRNILSRHEVNKFYQIINLSAGLKDLVPATVKSVKDQIKARRAKRGEDKPVKLPEGPPDVTLSTMLKRPAKA